MPQVEYSVSSVQEPAGGASLRQNRVSSSLRKRFLICRPLSHSLPGVWMLATIRGSQ